MNLPIRIFVSFLIIANTANNAFAEVAEYSIDVDYTTVNYTGTEVRALTLGGDIPGPVIEATVGDTLQVTFNNKLDEETSIHWHGVLLPNNQDGVPYLTTMPIQPKTSFTYRFKIRHTGTFWYHSHTGLQEQQGVYGPLIFWPKKPAHFAYEHALVFSDWNDESPDKVLANLKKDGDYYVLKKDSVQSWLKVVQHGWPAITNRVNGAWTRMGPMDLSDVGYDAFLVNGRRQVEYNAPRKGDQIRLRMVNASASSYLNLEFSGGDMTIIAADGVNTEPVTVSRLRIAIAETFDISITIPDNKRYELRATSQDGTGYSSIFWGSGDLVAAKDMPVPNPFVMDHSKHGGGMDHSKMNDNAKDDGAVDHSKMDHSKMNDNAKDDGAVDHSKMDHSKMDHSKMNDNAKDDGVVDHSKMDHSKMNDNAKDDGEVDHSKMDHSKMNHGSMNSDVKQMNEYDELRATKKTNLPEGNPEREVLLELTGNMERYVWSFNNKTLTEADKILIRGGENVKFTLVNTTMMNHPLHLHGHFFRVLNGQGDYSPLKHTVNVPPMQTVEIEFFANEDQDWFFHCHNLYHMKAGMARVIGYENSTKADSDIIEKLAHDNEWFSSTDISMQSNMTGGMLRQSNTRNAFELEWKHNYKNGYDVDAIYERSITKFLEVYAGGSAEATDSGGGVDSVLDLIRGSDDDVRVESNAIVGLHYVLPLLVEADLRADSGGNVSLGLGSELQLTDRLGLEFEVNTNSSYHLSLSYELSKEFSLTANYDSEFNAGAGVMMKF